MCSLWCLVLGGFLSVDAPRAFAADATPVRSNAALDVTFDEASGNAAVRVTGTDQAYKAVLQNGAERAASPFWNQSGKQALLLDAAKKQYALLSNIPYLDRPDAVSLSLFFLSLHDPGDDAAHGVVAKRAVDPRGTNYGINFHPKGDVFQVYVNDGKGYRIAAYRAAQVIGSRRLTHLTATFEIGDAPAPDADNERDDVLVRLFVNGRPMAPASITGGAAVGNDAWLTDVSLAGLLNDAPVTIGASTPDAEYTSGLFDEFLLFPRALTESEAAQLFLEVAGPNGRELARRELALANVSKPAAPAIKSILPAGLQAGATTRLTITGQALGTHARIELPIAIVKQETLAGANFGEMTVDVTLPADAPAGYVPLNVVTDGGASNSMPVVVDSLVQQEASATTAEKPATLPGAFTGIIAGSQLARVYFQAVQNQTLQIEVETRRLGAALDPVLEVKSPAGAPLLIEWGRAPMRGDARAEFTPPEDGLYYVELHDLSYNAPGQNPFRVRIGALDAVDRDPAPLMPIQVGTEVVEARPSEKELQTIDARFAEQKHAPVYITGDISAPGEEDRYVINVTPEQTLNLTLITRSIGSPLNGELLVLKHPEGTLLAGSEERPDNPDPGLDFAIPANVTAIQLAVRDLHRAAGPRHRYRVRIVPPGQPDFRLAVRAARLNLPENGSAYAELQIDRAGYGGPIQLSVVGDESVTISPQQIPPEGNGRTALITLSRSGPGGAGALKRLQIVGESEGLTPPLRRTAVVSTGAEAGMPGYADRLPMGVTAPLSVKLDAAQTPPVLLKGLDAAVKLAVSAEGDAATQSVRLSLVSTEPARPVNPNDRSKGNKPKVEAQPGQTISAGAPEAELRISVPLDVQEPAIDFVIRAEVVPHAYSKNVLATIDSKPFRLAVQNAVAINFDTTTFNLAAGAEGRVKGKIARTAPFAGAVDLALSGLPEGYKAAPVNIPADKDEFELVVTSPAVTEAATLSNLNVAAASGGRTLLNQGLELKVAPAAAQK